ncbi:MAG: hypothetical protein AB4426_22685 [Xenococcaceae cyanobacterium]
MVKKLRAWTILSLPVLAFLIFSFLWDQPFFAEPTSDLTLEQPSNQPSPTEERLIGQTPEELGPEYKKLLVKAREAVSAMPPDTPIIFPLGVNYPIRIADLPTGERSSQENQLEAIGFVNSSGQAQSFTASDIIEMFDRQINIINGGSSRMTPVQQSVLVADASGILVQTEKVPVIDLIARIPQRSEAYLVKKVRWIGVFRDTLNAALNGEIKKNEYDLRELDMRRLREQPDITI